MATRRAVTAGLVVLCVLLFTVFAAEGSGGPLHAVQRGVGSLMAPFQGITSKAVRPLRDGWGWIRDTADARDRAAQLEQVNRDLRTQIVEGRYRESQTRIINRLAGVGDDWRRDYQQRPAQIINTSPSPWYDRADLNVGTSQGVVEGSPVLAPGPGGDVNSALAGVITRAAPNYSTVTFLTEGSSAVGVTIQPSGAFGLAEPTVAGQMQVTGIPRRDVLNVNDIAYTSGRGAGIGLPSRFPAGIPVGWIRGTGGETGDEEWTVQLQPFVQPSSLSYVVVLAPSSDRARQRASYP